MIRVAEETSYMIEIDKSKFICFLQRVFSEDEAKDYLLKIKKMHPNATHHCYAFTIGDHREIQRSNDNGEPSGTAGVPILECLRKNDMDDTIAIVVRYYGGTKLGAGGLIRAYTKSCSEALKHATLTKKIKTNNFTIRFSYDFIGKIDHYIATNDITILDKLYEEDVQYHLQHSKDIRLDLQELSNGTIIPEAIEEKTVEAIIQKGTS